MDLESEGDLEITREHLRALQAIYFAYMLEESRLPQVVDRIVELFGFGLLPLGARPAAGRLAAGRAANRVSEAERRDLYQRVFGAPGGDADPAPNRDFNELWLRFVASVAGLTRSRRPEESRDLAITSARRAARDLASNLSRAGYGLAHQVAVELSRPIVEILDFLDDSALQSAFGARDRWSLIDRVNADQFGIPIDARRFRTQAEAGSTILGWLAEDGSGTASADDSGAIDEELIAACEQWLAASGLPAGVIDHYAESITSSSTAAADGLLAVICRFLARLRAALRQISGRSPGPPSPDH
jgi:hypothetical protein